MLLKKLLLARFIVAVRMCYPNIGVILRTVRIIKALNLDNRKCNAVVLVLLITSPSMSGINSVTNHKWVTLALRAPDIIELILLDRVINIARSVGSRKVENGSLERISEKTLFLWC